MNTEPRSTSESTAPSYAERCIRAAYTDTTIRVYQAYSDAIADTALARGTFVSPPFKMVRMTWIKPSFCWMMYRAGWGGKDPGQKRILGIDISRDGFEWALANSCLSSHVKAGMDKAAWEARKADSPIRIQWDPERDIQLRRLDYRSIQIGLTGRAVQMYVNEWIIGIEEVTELAGRIRDLAGNGDIGAAERLLPTERVYTPGEPAKRRIYATVD